MTMKKRLTGLVAALAVLLLLAGCGADARHEIYRVCEGRNGDWTLEVRRWVERDGWMLLPADLQSDDSGVWTRTYWEIAYHGKKSAAELNVTRLEVSGENWSHSSEIGDEEYLGFDTGHSWVSDNSASSGINVGNSEACYALLTDADGHTIRIDAPLTRSKG